MKISLIIPAHNEEENLSQLIPAIMQDAGDYIFEIIIIDDNSSDSTGQIAENLKQMGYCRNFKVIHRVPPPGVGYALREGFRAISEDTEWVLTMDCDFLKNVEDIRRLIEKVSTGYDGAIGSRFADGTRLVNYPFSKQLLNRGYHLLVWIILGIQQKDLTNNFKLYKKEIISSIEWESNDFSINAETGIFPIIYGFHIAEVPVFWIQRDYGTSKFHPLKYGKGYLKVLIKAIKLKPKLENKPIA
jgi:glycosyltransferase involved in cell wall biosynthesis